MTFAKIISKYINRPFKVGGTTLNGLDCLGILGAISTDLELQFPKEFNGITEENYYELYMKDRKNAEETLVAFFDTVGNEVSVNEIVAGDWLIINQRGRLLFPAMYVGNGNAVTSSIKEGVKVFSIEYPNTVIMARRLSKCHQQ